MNEYSIFDPTTVALWAVAVELLIPPVSLEHCGAGGIGSGSQVPLIVCICGSSAATVLFSVV